MHTGSPDHSQVSAKESFKGHAAAVDAGDCTAERQSPVFQPDAAACCLLGKAGQLPLTASYQEKGAAAGLKAAYWLTPLQCAALGACDVAAAWCNLQRRVGACGEAAHVRTGLAMPAKWHPIPDWEHELKRPL